jgi:NAD(P)-dependent dehydrogenase (short-subunit alcohol dehydrogenase family)
VRSLGIEMAQYGIRTNAVAPGAITNTINLLPGDTSGVPLEKLKQAMIPLGRNGIPAEIASVVAFLASGQASYITGQIIYVDGGLVQQLGPRGVWI